jgi:hypothetical protein
MKHLLLILLSVLVLAPLPGQGTVEYSIRTRTWTNGGADDGSTHPIGNGQMLVYGQGPDITRVFGPPYSSPSFFEMSLKETGRNIRVESRREKNTAVWHHIFFIGSGRIAEITDYILPDKPVFFRDVDLKEELNFTIRVPEDVNAYPMGNYFSYIPGSHNSSVLFAIPMGTTFFVRNPVPHEQSLFMTGSGSVSISGANSREILVSMKPGKGRLILSSNISHPVTVSNMEDILKNPGNNYLDQSREFWYAYASRRPDFNSRIRADHPLKDGILDAIDGVSVLIKCQQSSDGGVMAGHKYNMAYVRDMSGVFRGLMALGYIPEARAILDFWLRKFALFGNVLCADGMGNDAARLPLTNDEVEVPAYLIHNCFLYYEQTKDDDFMAGAFPMMEWAFEIQLPHLVEGMTEFSGDETYIAGGTFRGSLYQGSAESTLLFITGGEKLIRYAGSKGLWDSRKLGSYHEKVAEARNRYKDNFIRNGVLYANNPRREILAVQPRFRIGFCALHDRDQSTPLITWTERDQYGRYVCPDCRQKEIAFREPDSNKIYYLNSVSLIPAYIHSDLFTEKELGALIKPGVELFTTKNKIPSNIEGNRSLGYDYGLFLYNMVMLDNPLKEKALDKMMSVLDDTSAWGEYYDDEKPYNCRTRPWESAMNVEALIEYLQH